MFFRRKKKGSYLLRLNDSDQFCKVLDENAADCSRKYRIDTEDGNYNLLYRNGQFLGMPTPFGGPIYPFSIDPTQMGSNAQKRKFTRAKIVCISKDFNLKVYWGTRVPFTILDPETKKPYSVGASGVFYVNIDTNDAGRNADMFYRKCISQIDSEVHDTEQVKGFLSEAFANRIGAKLQEYVEFRERRLDDLAGLQPRDFLMISEEIYGKIKDIFAEYGLTVVEEASKGSILTRMVVNPIEGEIE